VDITAALKDLEDQKADLLEHISRLSKVRADLLLPEGVKRLQAESDNLRLVIGGLREEIAAAEGRAGQIVARAESDASRIVGEATEAASAARRSAESFAADIDRVAVARGNALDERASTLKVKEDELGRRVTTFEATVKHFAAERKHLASLIRPFIEELDR